MTALVDLSDCLIGFAGGDPVLGPRVRAAAAVLRREAAVCLEHARDAAVRMGSCSEAELADELGVSSARARELLEDLAERQIVRLVPGPRGLRWHYRTHEHDVRLHHEPERVVERRPGAVAGTGGRSRTGGNASYNHFLTRVRRAGGRIRKLPSGHIEIVAPHGTVRSASTPRASSFPKQIKQLRAAGLDI